MRARNARLGGSRIRQTPVNKLEKKERSQRTRPDMVSLADPKRIVLARVRRPPGQRYIRGTRAGTQGGEEMPEPRIATEIVNK